MKASCIVITVAVGLALFTGCISVESTRAQLASGNPQLIQEANDNIYKKAVWQHVPIQERVSYITLTKDFDLLLRILKSTYDEKEIAQTVIRQMDFTEVGRTIKLLEGFKEIEDLDESVNVELREKILGAISEKELTEVIKRHGSLGLPYMWEIPFAKKLAVTTSSQDVLYGLVSRSGDLYIRDDSRELEKLVLDRLTDQKKLIDLFSTVLDDNLEKAVIEKLSESTVCSFIKDDKRLAKLSFNLSNWRAKALLDRVANKVNIVKAIAARKSEEGTKNLMFEMTQPHIAAVAILATNAKIRDNAISLLTDAKVIKQVLAGNRLSDEQSALELAKKLKDGDTDAQLYASIKSEKVKQRVLVAMPTEERAKIREADRARCQELIAAAKAKGAETFQLGGFYLGMSFQDVEPLLGYYFPTWSMLAATDSHGGKILRVPGQNSPFCCADKSGKVWRFNFGKRILKKFYNFDVQSNLEWWQKYKAAAGISQDVYKMQEADYFPSGGLGPNIVATYHQDTYQYKNNSKEYRIIFFDEYKIFSAGTAVLPESWVKQLAREQFCHLLEEEGTLRVQFDRD